MEQRAAMPSEHAHVRPARRADLGPILRLWQADPSSQAEVPVDQALELLLSDDVIALVAERRGRVVAATAAGIAGATGSILQIASDPAVGGEVTDLLLDELERRLVEAGARRLALQVGADAPVLPTLVDRGYGIRSGMVVLERDLPPTLTGPTALRQLGGYVVEPELWDSLTGMESAKALIERRVILPLAEPELAQRHGVSLPKAIVLFGPPGTGKTTFAKGVASRLQWPFVEIEPGELAGDGFERAAKRLAETFRAVLELPSAVVFIDEVEDIASERHADRRVASPITNELLKQIPQLREAPYHLLVCATNWVGRLDPAFLRPGRFDYVIPVGPPDPDARAAIWQRYVSRITDQPVDVRDLVNASEWFTAADIEHAARKAAQLAFEREHLQEATGRAATEEFLTAIRETRPTLDAEMIRTFDKDVGIFSRL